MIELCDPGNSTESKRQPVSISVFFPCYNESSAIRPLVEKTLGVLNEISSDFEIIIVNDGSTDDTPGIADALSAEFEQVRAVHHETNSGYGAALQSGFKAATKELVFYTDGDAQFDIAELLPLIPLMKEYDVISCYRLNRQDGAVRKVNAWCWGKLVCLLFGMKIRDIDCAFKLFRREIFDNIKMKSTGALIDAEVLARALRKGYTLTQMGVHHYPRTAGTQTGANLKVIACAFKELLKLRKEIRKESR